jgi:regulator of sirC expression with transglutaminase-like and TPR domain
VSLSPALAWPLRERGLLAARLGAIEAARADLERALALCGDAKNDADQIRGELHRLAPRKRSLN